MIGHGVDLLLSQVARYDMQSASSLDAHEWLE